MSRLVVKSNKELFNRWIDMKDHLHRLASIVQNDVELDESMLNEYRNIYIDFRRISLQLFNDTVDYIKSNPRRD